MASKKLLICVVCMWCLSPLAQAQINLNEDGNASAWLSKMAEAKRSLNYQISFVLLKPGIDAQPYLWRHAVNADGVEMEQLDLLNGPGREVIRVGNVVSYFEPNVPPYSLATGHINGPLPSLLFDDPMSLQQAYEFVLVGRSRISGRAAQQIRIVSRDKSRFGLNLWLDQDTGLVLKLNMVDANGQAIEQIQVTELKVTDKPDAFFESLQIARLPEVVQVMAGPESKQTWQLDFLPVGMKQVKRDIHRLPLGGGLVEYMMLSDGLIDVSVYLQNISASTAEGDILLRHESNIYLTRTQGPVLVTVIGKLPAQTANAIASSVSLVDPK